ncbi:hypothetical protein [Fontibacillus sp. BL9]|uniref:hypothetical protein n=1 Tax=Fontibacillus sp. BL9 TaxID=3389971 RepID=UPI00397DC680
MRVKLSLLLLIFALVFVGCSNNDLKQGTTEEMSKELISIQGQSEHWKVNYVIKESSSSSKASKYMLQCIIEPRNQETIFDVAYDVASPGNVSQLSGTITSDNNSSISDKVISPSIDTNFLPQKGEDIVITIKWNKKFEERIVLSP